MVTDFFAQFGEYLQFFHYDPTSRDDQLASLHAHRQTGLREEVLTALRAVNSTYQATDSWRSRLERLLTEGGAFVITGQQVNLFGGPVYVYYKILTAINYARFLEAESGIPLLPLFWVQAEDHDWDEVRSATYPGLTSSLSLPGDNLRVPLSQRELPAEVTHEVSRLCESIGRFEHANELLKAVSEAYRPGVSPVDAFCHFIASVFPKGELLFWNPRHPAALKATAPLFAKTLRSGQRISQLLGEQSSLLSASGLEIQVPIREGYSLLAYQSSPLAPRTRLKLETSAVSAADVTLTLDEADTLISNHPERFTSTALLRPLIQDSLFPVAAYVAGPAEIRYQAQIQPLYSLFSLPHPFILPRLSFSLLEIRHLETLKQNRIEPSLLHLPLEEFNQLIAEVLASTDITPARLAAEAETTLQALLASLRDKALTLDATLADPLRKTEEKMNDSLTAFIKRYQAALLRKNDVALQRVLKVREFLYPRGNLQEREVAFIYFLAKYGDSFTSVIDAGGNLFEFNQKRISL